MSELLCAEGHAGQSINDTEVVNFMREPFGLMIQCTMAEMELLRDDEGREAVRFVTPSGVIAVIATCVSDAALDKFIRGLKRKLARHAGRRRRDSPRARRR